MLEVLPNDRQLMKLVARAGGFPLERVQVPLVGGAPANMCYWNVRDAIAANGGSAIYCWRPVWLRDVYIRAQHHAVWKRPDGEIVDITPFGNLVRPAGSVSLLLDQRFVPDLSKGSPRYDNLIVNLCKSGLVDRYGVLEKEILAREREHGDGVIVGQDAEILGMMKAEFRRVRDALFAGHR